MIMLTEMSQKLCVCLSILQSSIILNIIHNLVALNDDKYMS